MPRMRHRPRIRPRTAVPAAVAAASAVGFAAITWLVEEQRTRGFDQRVHRRLYRTHNPAVRATVHTLGYTGKSWMHSAAATLIGGLVSHRGSLDGSRAIKLSSALGTTASRTFDWLLAHRRPPPGRHNPAEQSYPSGHTLETAAVALTAAYVLWREGLVDAPVAFPTAVAIPLLEGAGRLYLDRHWATDVVGGLLGGVCVAALCATGYEAKR